MTSGYGGEQGPAEPRDPAAEQVRDGDFARADWECEERVGEHYLRCRFDDARLLELVTRGCVFEDCDFAGTRLGSSVHERSAFLRCRFRRADLFDATFRDCKLTGSQFGVCGLRPLRVEGGDWSYVALRGAELAGVSFDGVRMREVDLTDADLQKATFDGADLSHARLVGANLAKTDLRGADLSGVDWRSLELRETRLDLGQAMAFATAYGALVV